MRQLIRIVEMGSHDPARDLREINSTYEAIWRKHRSYAPVQAPQSPYILNLVVFGPVDFLSVQVVPDLKILGMPATLGPTRFQRVIGAWNEGPLPSADPEQPFIAVCYIKINPLADLVSDESLVPKVIREFLGVPGVYPLHGLDSARIVMLIQQRSLAAVEPIIWRLRRLTLGRLGTHCNREILHALVQRPHVSLEEIEKIRVVSWSHTVVGLPVEFTESPELLPREVQHIGLRSKYRLLPSGFANIPSAGTMFGSHDLVHDHGSRLTNAGVAQALHAIWKPQGDYLVETEVELLSPTPQKSEGEIDPLSQEYSSQRYLTNQLITRVGRQSFRTLSDFPTELRGLGWSYQRTNGAVNLLSTYLHRISDPFDIGRTWRLYAPFTFWLDVIFRGKSAGANFPTDDAFREDVYAMTSRYSRHLRRLSNYLERSVRLDDDQEDPAQRPSLPLSFAARGGYGALREAFTAYTTEFAQARSIANLERVMPNPLIVDSADCELLLKPLFRTFVLLLSGFQMQALPLWPFVVHEIEHVCLMGRGYDLQTTVAEARCDLAMIVSGALGEIGQLGIDELLERATRVIAGSTMPQLHEIISEEAKAQMLTKLVQRLAYLHVFATAYAHGRPPEFSRADLRAALDSAWLRRWGDGIVASAAQDLVCTDALMNQVFDRYQSDSIRNAFVGIPPIIKSEPGECAIALGEAVTHAPKQWFPSGSEINVGLPADMVTSALERLRGPVLRARNSYLFPHLLGG